MTWTPCSPDCILPVDDPDAYPLSASTRAEAAWVSDGLVIRSIAAGGHPDDHPFTGSTEPPTVGDRHDLLQRLMTAAPEHVLPVTGLCECSFASPLLDGRPLQDFGLGPDANRLIHPSQRRIAWPHGTLESVLADLAEGLKKMHDLGVTHGDPALMNAYTVEGPNGYEGVWIDLNSVQGVSDEAIAIDIAAFEHSCLWPALIDADFASPSLYADLASEAVTAGDTLEAYASALRHDRSDHVAGGTRATLNHALMEARGDTRSDLIGVVRNRMGAAMAPFYFLDQTRSDQTARFLQATLRAEQERHRILEEERTRLHHHRFTAENEELRTWAASLQEAAEHHRTRAEAAANDRAADAEAFDRKLAEVRKEISDADARIAEAEAHGEALTAQRDEAHERARRVEQELADAAQELRAAAGVRESLAGVEARAASFRVEADQLRRELNDIYESRGWAVITKLWAAKSAVGRTATAPMRALRKEQDTLESIDATPPPAAVEPVARQFTDVTASRYPVTVSVIMPVYNKGMALLEAIESVQRQTLTDVEIVLWDDGSSDAETVRALEEAEKHPRVYVFRAPNKGVIEARNSAMRFARGEFMCCLDPDDQIGPTYLQKAVALLRGDPTTAIAYPWQRTTGGKVEVWRTQDLDAELIGTVNHVPVCAVFRRDVFVQTGGFSAEMGIGYEDWEFWAHAAELGFKGRVIPEPLFEYHYSASADESRDAVAREKHLDLATRIGMLHPLLAADRVGEIVTRTSQGVPSLDGLRLPHIPQGSGRPVIMTLPWFTLGGADRMVETLVRHWVDEGRTVVVLTTLELGGGMQNRVDELLDITPYVYQLTALLPHTLWFDFVTRLLSALEHPTIVNIGSSWLQASAGALRQSRPDLRIIDHHFNDAGHIAGNREFVESFDLTVVAYEGLIPAFVADGRSPDTVVSVLVGIEPPRSVTGDEMEAARDELGLKKDVPVAAFIGRFAEEKNPDWLPRLAASLRPDDITILAVGDGPMAGALEPEMEAADNLVWRKHVDDIEVILATADVVILPSRIEGIPLVLMEALALGTAVVATRVGGIPELDGTPGMHLVVPGDFDGFCEAIRDAVKSDVTPHLPDGYHAAAMLERYDALVDAGLDDQGGS